MRFAADAAADDAQHVTHRLHVLQVRDVRYFGDSVGEEGCCHHGEHGVLRTGNFYFPVQGLLDLRNDKLVHIFSR